MKLKDFLVEGPASLADIKKAMKKFGDTEPLRVAVMNRERTNHDSRWQADYFYGDKKEMSKKQGDLVVNAYIELEKILKDMDIKDSRITDAPLLKFFMGDKDPAKFFKEGTELHPKYFTLVETIDFDKIVESVGTVKLTGRLGTMAGIFGQLKPKQVIAVNTHGDFTDVEDFNDLKSLLKSMATEQVIKKIKLMITNKDSNDSFNKYKDLELPKTINNKDFDNTLLANAVLDATDSKLQVMANAAPELARVA